MEQDHLDELNNPARRCLRFEEEINLQSKNRSSNLAMKDEFPGKQAAYERKVMSKICGCMWMSGNVLRKVRKKI